MNQNDKQNKILMWTAMFISFSRPAAVLDVLADVWDTMVINAMLVEAFCIDVWDCGVIGGLLDIVVGVSVDMMDVEVIVLDVTRIDFGVGLAVSYAVDVMAGV